MASEALGARLNARLETRITHLRERMALRLKGPTAAPMSARDLRLQVQNMDPIRKMDMQQGMGPDKWAEMMEALYSG